MVSTVWCDTVVLGSYMGDKVTQATFYFITKLSYNVRKEHSSWRMYKGQQSPFNLLSYHLHNNIHITTSTLQQSYFLFITTLIIATMLHFDNMFKALLPVAALIFAVSVVSAQESDQSAPFNLVLLAKDSQLNGTYLRACHTGAASKSLCESSLAQGRSRAPPVSEILSSKYTKSN